MARHPTHPMSSGAASSRFPAKIRCATRSPLRSARLMNFDVSACGIFWDSRVSRDHPRTPQGMTSSALPEGDRARPRSEWVKLVLVPVAVALVIAALTPLGDGVREVLFPTKAALSGTVTMDGRPVVGAVVVLDGQNAGKTDPTGAYVITGVGDGSHVVEVRATGAHPSQVAIAVQRGATEVKAEPVDLRPLVELGYTITSLDLRPSGQQQSAGGFVLKYDFTLWVHGDAATLGRVASVSYALPAPLTAAPVAGNSPDAAFCYRQSGRLSFDRLLGSPGLGAASATVTLVDGQSFPVVGQAGDRPPPRCKATKAATQELQADESPTTPPSTDGGRPPPPPPPPPPTPTPSPTPPASGPRILSFTADRQGDCTGGSGSVTFRYDVVDAENVDIVQDGANRIVHGALFKMPTSVTMDFPCDGQPHTYELTVSDAEGRHSEPRTVTVE